MMRSGHVNQQGPISIEDKLNALLSVLQTERRALLDGDAKTVAELALKKDKLAAALRNSDHQRELGPQPSTEIVDLTARVAEQAATNHVLLTQMYQHYQGMLDLLSRLAGQGTTYGRHGFLETTLESSSSARLKV